MKLPVSILFALVVRAVAVASRTGSPVEKVVNLLKDLQSKIENDGKVEQQTYDKYACWCEKTADRKSQAIEAAQSEMRALGQTILKLKGKVATLTSEIDELSEAIATNEAEQQEATNLRQKENEAYTSEATEMKQAIAALQRATQIIVEGASQEAATEFVQTAGGAVRGVLQNLPATGRGLTPEHLALLQEFTQGSGRYAPQSATVQGILKDMYETFTSDLESATNDEATANRDFETFIATKTVELNTLESTKATKEAEKAEAEAQLADTTQIYDDTEAQMKADIEFFDATKSACEAKAAEWKTRTQLRAEELRGIATALQILTSDSARELFGSAIKAGKETGMDSSYDSGIDIGASFIQVSSATDAETAAQNAYAAMRVHARKAHSLRLAALAVRVREAKVGHFDQVIQAIDEMMAALKEEDAADIAKRDQCKEEYTKTASVIAKITWLIEKNVAKIDKLESEIESKTKEKDATIVAINETEANIQTMTDERNAENTEFHHDKDEDEAAVALLLQTRDALMSYYSNHSIDLGPIQGSVKGIGLAQQPDFVVSADQAPDAVFTNQGEHKDESKGIVQIMTYLIEDLNDEISNGMKNEAIAQMEFEKQIAAAEKLKSDLIIKKDNLETTIARLDQDKADEHSTKAANEADLQDEKNYRQRITPDCDWILGAFEERAKKRANELSGLTAAKSLLAGSNSKAAFIQDASAALIRRKVRFLGLGA